MTDRLNEYSKVEKPLLDQLQAMGWEYLEGDIDVPYLTERDSFREVLLTGRLREALHGINLDENGQPWLDDSRLNQAVSALERLGAASLIEANETATHLLLTGATVEGDPHRHGGREQTIHFIDFEHPERNDFLVINQFRVDPPWAVGDRDFIIPDLVLFVNGIPLVVIECKSPNLAEPMEAGITQLRRYTNQREEVEQDEGAERLFHYNQFLVSTYYYEARTSTISGSYKHYLEWKYLGGVTEDTVRAELGLTDGAELTSQQKFAAGMLRPAHLLDIVCNFTLFKTDGGRRVKIVGRYHQVRAVHKAVRRLRTGQTRAQHGESDQRGGIVWHTQGSGKSLTMVFLIRKMRTLPDLRRFKVVFVTDRIDLQEQLSGTATLTGETVRTAASTRDLKDILREPGPDLVFAMIQKYQDRDLAGEIIEWPDPEAQPLSQQKVAEESAAYQLKGKVLRFPSAEETFEELNPSEYILIIVDEAHRSHASALHANLMLSLPNCAKIGFTGTPILIGDRKRTHEIFGDFIDRYTIKQSETDGATVPIIYEGRTATGEVADGRSLDQIFEDMFREYTPKEMEAIKAKYATQGHVLEAKKMIAAKADDILRHYVSTVLPEGFKAQVVSYSRRAAIRYQKALVEAQQKLLAQLEQLPPNLLALSEEELAQQGPETQFLVRAYALLPRIRQLEFATVISGSHNDDPAWKEWSDKAKIKQRIDDFKKPFVDLDRPDPHKQSDLAFLCVKSMLLTGFDAPHEQVLYLDRVMHGHELLQAIARVNRTGHGKQRGFVVDYVGVARHLTEALAVYSAEDVQGAMTSIRDELPILVDRHQRVLAVFHERDVADIANVDDCVALLRDEKIRAEFVVKFKRFLESLNVVMPRPEALPYQRDAKILGFINQAAANMYRDSQLNIAGVGHKVRQLIDDHVLANGIDPKVPPISIMDADFEKVVDAHVSSRAKASEMEHAARHHISVNFNSDPVYYKKLSRRLEEILQRFQDNWDDLVMALQPLIREIRQGRPVEDTNLDPTLRAFRDVLAEEAATDNPLPKDKLTELTAEMLSHIGQKIRRVDFWRNTHAQTELRSSLVLFLDDHDLVDLDRQEAVADQLVDMAKHHHQRLTTQ